MTSDDIGLSFFTQPTPSSPAPSVFGPTDQDALLDRIDAVDEDDLDSDFFADSMLDVENASTRAFDIGIRTLGTGVPRVPDAQGAQLTTEGIDVTAAPAADSVEVPEAGSFGGEAERTAFILGGPAGLG